MSWTWQAIQEMSRLDRATREIEARLANGSERMDYKGGRRLTVPGVGLCQVMADRSVIALESLGPDEYERLQVWLATEWPLRKEAYGGY